MTLCGMLSGGGSFVAFGDVMLSRRFGAPVTIPTTINLATQESARTKDGFSPSGLHQKAVLVRPNILMLWSGNYKIARSFYRFLASNLVNSHPSPRTVLSTMISFPDDLKSLDIELCIFVIDQDNYTHTFVCNTHPYCLEGIEKIITLGNGTSDTFNPLFQDIISSSIKANNSAITALRFFSSALIQQSLHGYGLENSWGGGFEIVVKDDLCFRKIDTVLVRGWTVGKINVFKLLPTKYWFFQAYNREHLEIYVIDPYKKEYRSESFTAINFGPANKLPAITGLMPASHIVDLVFPVFYSMEVPYGMSLKIHASESKEGRVMLDSKGSYVVRQFGEEMDILWDYLNSQRGRGAII